MRTQEEIEQEIKELEEDRFYHAMQDNWTHKDFEQDDKDYKRLQELKVELEKVKNG